MDFDTTVMDFLKAILDDPRIAPNHISLFMAILYFYQQQNCNAPIAVFSRDLMKHAKISAIATYTKCVYDLKAFGYIDYIPSYNPLLGSLITPLKLNS